jgi:hypothetical protein
MLDIFPVPKSLNYTGGHHTKNANPILETTSALQPEGYSLTIEPEQIRICGDKNGLRHGRDTLRQIQEQAGEGPLPCMEIRDEPSLRVRGFMLDISRCKVPTMETLRNLVLLLAKLRYNQLQLYTEHTFAFRDHETVWREASPMTPEEVREIDSLCIKHGIELVPNFNSFGHFERWLRHEPYRHLAECPDGFEREEPRIVRDHGGTLRPDQATLDFLGPLHDEFLENFTSGQFNVGLDEPWELGQGWSRPLVEGKGRHTVYIEFLQKIHKLVEGRGKTMLFWSDILLERPDFVDRVPKDAVPVIWGYESDHPFADQCRQVADCGLDYIVSPGTSTWNSFNGRLPNALDNIRAAISNARKYGALGSLLTTWGDNGNHQPWGTMYPAIFYHAGLAWNHGETSYVHLPGILDRHLFQDETGQLSKTLFGLGNADYIIERPLINCSPTFHFLFGTEKKLSTILGDTEPRLLDRGQRHLKEIRTWLEAAHPQCPDADTLGQELNLAIDLGILGLQRARDFQSTGQVPELNEERTELANRHRKIWLRRARVGGLEESIGYIKDPIGKTI